MEPVTYPRVQTVSILGSLTFIKDLILNSAPRLEYFVFLEVIPTFWPVHRHSLDIARIPFVSDKMFVATQTLGPKDVLYVCFVCLFLFFLIFWRYDSIPQSWAFDNPPAESKLVATTNNN